MGIKRHLACPQAYPDPCRFYPLHKTVDWNNNYKRINWMPNGISVPQFELDGAHMSAPYSERYAELDEIAGETDDFVDT
jgi:hypothetical protein